MSFRKPDDFTVDDRVDRPNLSVRQFDGTEEHEKAENVAEKARSISKKALRTLPEALADAVRGHLAAPMPDEERVEEDVRHATEAVLDGWRSHFEELRNYLSNRRDEAVGELPQISSGPASPGEEATRSWVREAPEDERLERIRKVVDSGNPEQARALFRKSIPAEAAGFPDEDMREGLRDDALRAAAPQAFETATSLNKDLKALERDRKKVEHYAHKVAGAAMTKFDKVVAQRAAQNEG